MIWFTLLPALYLGSRFIIPLPLPLFVRVWLFLMVLMVAECHLVYKLMFGNLFAPEFPHWLMVAFNWLFGSLLIFILCLLVRDLWSAAGYLFSHQWVARLSSAYLLLIASLLVAAFATWQAIKVPDVKTVTVRIQNLPAAFDGYRVIQLTDLHASTLFNRRWMEKVVARTNQLHADTILMTGDVADGSVKHRFHDVAPLADLQATSGRYAVPGNHEYYSGFDAWMRRVSQLGFTTLINQSVLLTHTGQSIILAGITDQAALRFQQAGPDLDLALAGKDRTQPIILMDHRPENARKNLAAGVDLQLSGHTHGGMIYGLDLIVKRINQGFYSGEYWLNHRLLYVSNGTGLWSGFALRLGHPSEITLFILEAGQ